MTTTNLKVRIGVVDGQQRVKTYTGTLAYPASEGLVLRFRASPATPLIEITVTNAAYSVPTDAAIVTATRLFPTLADAQQFASDLTTAVVAAGFTAT